MKLNYFRRPSCSIIQSKCLDFVVLGLIVEQILFRMIDQFDVEAYKTWKNENKETTAEPVSGK
jgi:hypothetical protein